MRKDWSVAYAFAALALVGLAMWIACIAIVWGGWEMLDDISTRRPAQPVCDVVEEFCRNNLGG